MTSLRRPLSPNHGCPHPKLKAEVVGAAHALGIVAAVLLVACGSDVERADDGTGGATTGSASTSAEGGGDATGGGGTDPTTSVGGGGGDGGGGGASACDEALDEATLDSLVLSGNGAGILLADATAHPGDVVTFGLGTLECCYNFETVAACASFSVDDPTAASVDPTTGVVTVDEDAPHGTVVRVTADVEEGRRSYEALLHVWTEAGNPIAGTYSETAQIDCDTGEEIAPPEPIGELRLGPDMRFGVTWQPFEVYVDYWGTYAIDLETGAIELTVESGNYVPEDIDPSGTFALEDGRLVLRQMWLGAPPVGGETAQCGHVFE